MNEHFHKFIVETFFDKDIVKISRIYLNSVQWQFNRIELENNYSPLWNHNCQIEEITVYVHEIVFVDR